MMARTKRDDMVVVLAEKDERTPLLLGSNSNDNSKFYTQAGINDDDVHDQHKPQYHRRCLSKLILITLVLPGLLIVSFLSGGVLGRSITKSSPDNNITPANHRNNPLLPPRAENISTKDFDWEALAPSDRLKYVPCFGDFLCARLVVPLDYNDPTNPNNATLAVLNLPSPHEGTPLWEGPVLMNPGGPGGSGVGWVLAAGRELQGIIGDKYSIIGWDPRGVNNTVPRVDCFPEENGDNKRRHLATLMSARGIGSSGTKEAEDVDLGDDWVNIGILSERCYRSIEKQKAVGLLGTAMTATDMVSITERSWDLAGEKVLISRAAAGKPKRKGVQYWGLSYGSVLGITFAQMFPDKVERVIVDGIVDVPDYYHGQWAQNLHDAELVVDSFFTTCQLAGPLLCAFYTPDGNGRERLATLLEKLRRRPVRVASELEIPNEDDETTIRPDVTIMRYTDLRSHIFTSLYGPLQLFPILASLLSQTELALAAASESGEAPTITVPQPPNPLLLTCPSVPGAPPKRNPDDALAPREATGTILCSDGAPNRPKDTYAQFKLHLENLRAQSPTAADIWATIRMACIGFPSSSPSTIPPTPPLLLGDASAQKINPKNKVLIIGNTGDPVTPLRNAFQMRDLMFVEGRAGVATQVGFGHCSVSAPSACMARLVRGYFESGDVGVDRAGRGTVCAEETRAFLGSVVGGGGGAGGGEKRVQEEEEEEEDKRLRGDVGRVGEAWRGLRLLKGLVGGAGGASAGALGF